MPERFYITLVGRQMFLLFVITLFCLRLPLFKCYFIDISLNDDNASNSLKLTCGPRTENLELESNHRILWQGSQFGHDERQKLSEMLPTDVVVPNMSISSSERYACYLIARKDSSYVFNSQRKRVLRESLGSIPLEDGVCRPGYRINGDRCFPCFPGSYTSGQDTECFLCPKDFYNSEKAADSCVPCPEGKKTVAQGADSLESCVYFDESGHPVKPETPPWVLIYSVIGVILLCVWIIIIIILIRHFSAMRGVDAEQVERTDRKAKEDSRLRKPLLSSSKEDDYENLSEDSEEKHIYQDIGDYEDTYEIPRKPSDPHMYADFEAPAPPPKTHRPSTQSRQKSVDSDQYEIPIKKVSDIEASIKRTSEDLRGIPRESSKGQFAIRVKKSSDQHEVPVKTDEKVEDLIEIPKPKDSENLYDSIDDDAQYVPDKQKSETYIEEIGRYASKTRSTGFEPGSASSKHSTERRKSMENTSGSKRSSASSKHSTKRQKSKENRSDERMAKIPEETENIYDIPESDSS